MAYQSSQEAQTTGIAADVVQDEGSDIEYAPGSISKNLTQTADGELRVQSDDRMLLSAVYDLTKELRELKTVMQFAHGINL
jgi:hypothetical protein